MKISTLVMIAMAITSLAMGQTTTKYYNDISSMISPQVPKEQAKYSRTTTENEDGTKTFEEYDLEKDRLISSKTYLRREPYGIWTVKKNYRAVELDYSFNLKYITLVEQLCADTLQSALVGNYMEDNVKVGYEAPTLINGRSLSEEIQKKFVYPQSLTGFGVSGKTYVQFEINESGEVQNVLIRKKNMIQLDKEAVRVLREMKFLPPKLEGQPIQICVTLPIGY